MNGWSYCRSMCIWEYDSVNGWSDCRSMCIWEYDSVNGMIVGVCVYGSMTV